MQNLVYRSYLFKSQESSTSVEPLCTPPSDVDGRQVEENVIQIVGHFLELSKDKEEDPKSVGEGQFDVRLFVFLIIDFM